MPFEATPIDGLQLYRPNIWEDERGYFFEAFNKRIFREAGIESGFVQDNQARSSYGVLRGLHYQVGAYAQAKLVRVLEGEVLDVVVDLRPDSSTYGHSYKVRLNALEKQQLYIPRGFAHGYVVLSQTAEFFYKCDNYYSKSHEGGILFNDPTLDIDWELPEEDLILSDKDRQLPTFGNHRN